MDWQTVLTTFGLVFVAELGDKTQLAVLTQTCKYRRPWAVFLGASLALTAVTAVGAAGGRVVGQLIPASLLQTVAALAFIAMGILVAREATQLEGAAADCPAVGLPFTLKGDELEQEAVCTCPDDVGDESSAIWASVPGWKAFGSTLALLFVAEMGDKTQLAVLSLAGKQANPWPVFIGGGLALSAVTGLGVIGGEGLCRIIPQRILLWVSAGAFMVMGVLIGLGIL